MQRPSKSSKTILSPPFYDFHLHGSHGVDFLSTHSVDEIIYACEELGKTGVSFFAPTLLTSELSELKSSLNHWGRLIQTIRTHSKYLPIGSAIPFGIHLEGPFISPLKAGAHEKKLILKPSISKISDLIKASKNTIEIITVAPELPGCLALIKYASSKNIRVQLGHTETSFETSIKAYKMGARGITHLFNAMKYHHRESGLLGFLQLPNVSAEIITDTIHVDAMMVNLILNSDAINTYGVSDGCSLSDTSTSKNTSGFLGNSPIEKRRLKSGVSAAFLKNIETLAGGAHVITQLPEILYKQIEHSFNGNLQEKEKIKVKILKLFWNLQEAFINKKFPKLLLRQKNYSNRFDQKTLHFMSRISNK